MTYVLQLADDPHFQYSTALLRALHFMMIQHDLDKSPGKYRAGPVFVYDEAQREVVYEGPTWDLVPGLTDDLVDQLNTQGEDSALVRGAMAHLDLVMIHPFRDGNGRMGRALQTLVLGREGILAPEFCSIEEYLGRNTPEYYEVLAEVWGTASRTEWSVRCSMLLWVSGLGMPRIGPRQMCPRTWLVATYAFLSTLASSRATARSGGSTTQPRSRS